MRVHPSILAPKAAKWQFSIAFGLLAFLLILNIIRGPREVVVADQTQDKRIDVVVAQKPIEAGQPLEQAALTLEQRPISTLPSDAITSFEAIKGKVAAGPIPAGYPLATALLADPVAMVPAEQDKGPKIEVNPVEALLEEIKADTVAVPVTFNSAAPARGTRVALALSGQKGQSVLLVDDAWVFDSEGTSATVRLESSKALLLQSSRNLGTITFIEIPLEGESPYSGKAVESMDALQVALGLKSEPKVAQSTGGKIGSVIANAADASRKRFRSYAWVSGEGIRFGVDEDGSLHVVDPQGYDVSPLEPDMR